MEVHFTRKLKKKKRKKRRKEAAKHRELWSFIKLRKSFSPSCFNAPSN